MAGPLGAVTSAAGNPFITGPLWYLLTRGPIRVRLGLLVLLRSKLRFSEQGVERLISALKWLWIIAVAKRVNARLNQYALNNWQWNDSKDKWTWNWEVAVVTGGSSGIGKEIVTNLVAKGVKVAILDIQEPPAQLQRNNKVFFVHTDVTSPSSIAEAARAVREELGEPSILVNNAGTAKPHAILETSNEFVQKLFQVNIISHFWLAKEFLPAMVRKNKGHIVGLASMASFVAPPGIVDYAATKSAVMAFHEGLGQEIKHIYKSLGVLNTVVHPSWVRTNMVAGYENHLEKTQGGLMNPVIIAKKITDQIFSARGGQLIIPKRLGRAAGFRGWPNWAQEWARDAFVGKASKFPGQTRSWENK